MPQIRRHYLSRIGVGLRDLTLTDFTDVFKWKGRNRCRRIVLLVTSTNLNVDSDSTYLIRGRNTIKRRKGLKGYRVPLGLPTLNPITLHKSVTGLLPN